MLDSILFTFLADVPSTNELIKGFGAPINTLAAKSRLAYSLGLLDKELFDTINIVRKIRNEFAHKWQRILFNTSHIQSLVSSLPVHPLQTISIGETRDIFDCITSNLLVKLALIPEVVKKQKRSPTRLIRFGKEYDTLEEAKLEAEEYKKTGIPPF